MNSSRWHVVNNEDDEIEVWVDNKFCVISEKIDLIHQYLTIYVKPADDIIYVGFYKKKLKIKGKRFLEVQNK